MALRRIFAFATGRCPVTSGATGGALIGCSSSAAATHPSSCCGPSSSCCPSSASSLATAAAVTTTSSRSSLLLATQRRYAQTLKDIEKHGDKGSSKLLKDLFPEVAMEVDQSAANIMIPSAVPNTPPTPGAVDLNTLFFDSGRRVQWRCKQCKYQWVSSVMARTILKQGCPSCHRRTNPLVGDVNPKLLQELHPTKNTIFTQPEALESTDRQRLWWLCSSCSCSFQARVCDRVDGKAPCPECDRGQFADFRIRKILMEEFHPTRNGDLTLAKLRPTDRVNVWWLCHECGHEFQTPVALRVNAKTQQKASGSCPKCHANKLLDKKSRGSDIVGGVRVTEDEDGKPVKKKRGTSKKKKSEDEVGAAGDRFDDDY